MGKWPDHSAQYLCISNWYMLYFVTIMALKNINKQRLEKRSFDKNWRYRTDLTKSNSNNKYTSIPLICELHSNGPAARNANYYNSLCNKKENFTISQKTSNSTNLLHWSRTLIRFAAGHAPQVADRSSHSATTTLATELSDADDDDYKHQQKHQADDDCADFVAAQNWKRSSNVWRA